MYGRTLRYGTKLKFMKGGAHSVSADHGKRVLIVDDDPQVRKFIGMVLQRSGYQVIATPDPVEALNLSRSEAPIDAVVTDVDLGDPRMNGFELAAAVKNVRPGVRVILISGCTHNADLAAGSSFLVLQKPFLPDKLIDSVKDMLAEVPR
jgi:DNA-binding NtrC family response regulator